MNVVLYRFEACTLDLARGVLRVADKDVDLRPKSFEVLRYLVTNAGRLISKEELIAAVWPNAVVTDESLTRCVSDVRAAIGDRTQTIIKTVPRRGYLFSAGVTCHAVSKPIGPTGSAARLERAVPDKPSIAVLPFTNMSDSSQEYLSDGVTEDIITELSRFSELFVIARNSSFQYRGNPVDVRQVGRELGVRYVLEGSFRRIGDRARISAQLIDAVSGAHRWAERYDRVLDDVFAVQHELAQTIVAILAAHVRKAEAERTLWKPPASWHAHDFYLRGIDTLASYTSSFNVDELYQARSLLEQAISGDPSNARAYAKLSWTHVSAWLHPLDQDFQSPAALERAYQLARQAVQLDPNLPDAHAHLGIVLTWQQRHEASLAEMARARELNPNYTDWRMAIGLVYAGELEKAVQDLDRHMRLDPFYQPIAATVLGMARYLLKQHSQAVSPLQECVTRAPNLRAGHIWLAATYAQLGQLAEAREEAKEVLRIEPKFTIEGTQRRISVFRRAEDREHYFDGLCKAGLPER